MAKILNKTKGVVIFDFNRTIFDPDKSQLAPGAESILDTFKKRGYSLYLICQAAPTRADLLKKLKIDAFFSEIIITPSKNIEMFRKIIAKEKQENVYVVGDRVRKEIAMGNQAGAKTIWLKSGKFATELPEKIIEQPKYIIKNINEVLDIIQ